MQGIVLWFRVGRWRGVHILFNFGKGRPDFFQSAGMKVTYTANIARSTFGTKSLDFVPSFGWIKECFM